MAGVTVNCTGVPAVVEDEALVVKPLRARALTVTVAAVLVTVPAVAVIFAVAVVDKMVVALPLESVLIVDGLTVPWSVANVTGTPPIGPPPASVTLATTVALPPAAPSVCGLAETLTVLAAAVSDVQLNRRGRPAGVRGDGRRPARAAGEKRDDRLAVARVGIGRLNGPE